MKKIFSAILAATTLLSSAAFAADTDISISSVSVKDGVVTVTVKNLLKTETEIMMTAIKENDKNNYSEDDRTYAMRQVEAKADATIDLNFVIPDERAGIRGSGTYAITVKNSQGDKAGYPLIYADSKAIENFVSALQKETAKTALANVVTAEENEAVLISLGVDYKTFIGYGEDIQQEAVNVLYAGGIENVTTENVSSKFLNTLGVSVYNNKDKVEGIKITLPTYGRENANADYFKDATDLMKESYDSAVDFEDDFKEAYGIVAIKNSTVDSVKEMIAVFNEETGLCDSEVEKIEGLKSTKSYKACKYIVEQMAKRTVTDADALADVLDDAYTYANKSDDGTGGGTQGTSANRVSSSSGRVSAGTSVAGDAVDEKPTASAIFSDLMSDHWAADSVKWLKYYGIVNGSGSGNFEPDRAVTREEFAKMLVLACGFETDEADTDFADAEKDGWYRQYIGVAAEKGIVTGIGDNLFGIGQLISRQDMAVMTERALKVKGIEIDAVRELLEFADKAQISDYAVESIETLYKAQIINGKGNNMFDPNGNATRAEAAKIIYEAFN